MGAWFPLVPGSLTDGISFLLGTNGNHAPIGQSQNGGSSTNSQEIPVSMDNVCLDGNEDQYVTSPSGEDLGSNVNVRRFKLIRNPQQRYNQGFEAARE